VARLAASPQLKPAAAVARLGIEVWLPIALFAIWWIASNDSKSLYFPSLQSILEAFGHTWLSTGLTQHVLPSLGNLAVGLVLAAVIGVSAGLLFGLVRPLGEALSPILEFLRAVPGVALLPLGLLLLGIGPSMKISLIAYAAVWPILLTTVDGVRGIDATVQDVARSYRVPLRLRLTSVVLPGAAPQIMTGMRTSLSIGITVIVFSEMAGSTEGIGYAVLQAQRSFAIAEMWSGMLALGIIGYLLNVAFRGLENRVLRWNRAMHLGTPTTRR
jgi:sulfonate transport system permease protein